MGLKIAIYVRVSRTDQVLENQINPLVEYCNRMGYTYEIFKEKESTRKSRPVQWDLYNRLLKKEFDGLLFYKLDRWARSLKELVTHMEALHEKGVILISYMENIDLSTSTGKLMMNIMGSFAEFERDIIRARTLAGLDRARAQGKTLGRPRIKRKYEKIERVKTITVPHVFKMRRKDGSIVELKARKVIKKGVGKKGRINSVNGD